MLDYVLAVERPASRSNRCCRPDRLARSFWTALDHNLGVANDRRLAISEVGIGRDSLSFKLFNEAGVATHQVRVRRLHPCDFIVLHPQQDTQPHHHHQPQQVADCKTEHGENMGGLELTDSFVWCLVGYNDRPGAVHSRLVAIRENLVVDGRSPQFDG